MTYYHGGVPGLRAGDVLLPGHSRQHHDGCPWCEARAAGKSLGGMDPPSQRDAVYVTTSREYAQFHASLYGRGDLYIVEPIGPLEESKEDRFPSWTCASAVVRTVYKRAVLLTWSQRRRMYRLWEAADAAAEAEAQEIQD